MDCAGVQDEILESLDAARPAARQREVDAHLATCVNCWTFAARQKALDEQLTATLKAPRLSPAFRATLRSRIGDERARASFDAFPDLVHLASCTVATLACAAFAPVDPALTLGTGVPLTLLSYVLLTLVRSSLEDLEA